LLGVRLLLRRLTVRRGLGRLTVRRGLRGLTVRRRLRRLAPLLLLWLAICRLLSVLRLAVGLLRRLLAVRVLRIAHDSLLSL
jgi:hypothetical protein